MGYQRVLDYLRKVEAWGIQPGIENTQLILKHFPDFNTKLLIKNRKEKFIQVAGTNGKGSTAFLLTSILKANGYRVGLFISPHLNDVRERISINHDLISKENFSNCFNFIKNLSEKLKKKKIIPRMPSYFEFIFLTAIFYFLQQEVEFIILEVGLGGRLDATTAITPDISVITTIAKDHTMILGSRLGDIAREKAGIIKNGIPVICGCPQNSISHRIIKSVATEQKAPFYRVMDLKNRLKIQNSEGKYKCCYETPRGVYEYTIFVNGRHQAFNAAIAIKTMQVFSQINPSFQISKDSILKGISSTKFPGRIESMNTKPAVILDAGHNVESIAALVKFLEENKKNKMTLVFGVLADKNYKKMITLLLPFIYNVILTEPLSNRALPVEKLSKYFKGFQVVIKKNPVEAYYTATQIKHDILVTGSFYITGAIRRIILTGG